MDFPQPNKRRSRKKRAQQSGEDNAALASDETLIGRPLVPFFAEGKINEQLKVDKRTASDIAVEVRKWNKDGYFENPTVVGNGSGGPSSFPKPPRADKKPKGKKMPRPSETKQGAPKSQSGGPQKPKSDANKKRKKPQQRDKRRSSSGENEEAFAWSSFQCAPDPSSLPMPSFHDDLDSPKASRRTHSDQQEFGGMVDSVASLFRAFSTGSSPDAQPVEILKRPSATGQQYPFPQPPAFSPSFDDGTENESNEYSYEGEGTSGEASNSEDEQNVPSVRPLSIAARSLAEGLHLTSHRAEEASANGTQPSRTTSRAATSTASSSGVDSSGTATAGGAGGSVGARHLVPPGSAGMTAPHPHYQYPPQAQHFPPHPYPLWPPHSRPPGPGPFPPYAHYYPHPYAAPQGPWVGPPPPASGAHGSRQSVPAGGVPNNGATAGGASTTTATSTQTTRKSTMLVPSVVAVGAGKKK